MSTSPMRHEAEVFALASVMSMSISKSSVISDFNASIFGGPVLSIIARAVEAVFQKGRIATFNEVTLHLRELGLFSDAIRKVLWEIGEARMTAPGSGDHYLHNLSEVQRLHDQEHALTALDAARRDVELGVIPELVTLTRSRVETAGEDHVLATIQAGSELQDLWDGKCPPKFLKTQWRDLTEEIGGGWRRGAINIIAARPGGGKSSMVEQEALVQAHQGRRVLFLPLEMGKEHHIHRMIRRRSYFNLKALDGLGFDRGRVSDPAQAEIATALRDMATPNLIWAEPVWNIQSVVASITKEHSVAPLDIIVIDYFQLLSDSSFKSGSNRNYELASIAKVLLATAKSTGAALLLCAQLNRSIESQGDRPPRLSDLADCGEMDNFTHTAMIMRPVGEPDIADLQTVDAHLVKARSGCKGVVKMKFHGPSMNFIPD